MQTNLSIVKGSQRKCRLNLGGNHLENLEDKKITLRRILDRLISDYWIWWQGAVPETVASFDHLTRLVALGDFIKFSQASNFVGHVQW